MRRAFSYIFRHVLALAIVATMLLPGGAQVLCIGGDGHVAIEPSHNHSTCESVRHTASGEDVSLATITNVENCTDFALPTSTALHSKRHVDSETTPITFAPLLFTLSDDLSQPAVLSNAHRDNHATTPLPQVISLHSTVLIV